MKKKIKVTETRTLIFELNPDWYAEGATLEDMINVEKNAAETNPEYFELCDNDACVSNVTVEIVD